MPDHSAVNQRPAGTKSAQGVHWRTGLEATKQSQDGASASVPRRLTAHARSRYETSAIGSQSSSPYPPAPAPQTRSSTAPGDQREDQRQEGDVDDLRLYADARVARSPPGASHSGCSVKGGGAYSCQEASGVFYHVLFYSIPFYSVRMHKRHEEATQTCHCPASLRNAATPASDGLGR